MALLECVPNVSEGRRPEVIARFERAVARGGTRLLDRHSDPDHNRTVLTLAGSADDLHASLLALYATAIETIDLRSQRGVHPRVGAVDVVPFIPLGEATMDEACAAARRLGEEVARRFGIPVWFYEETASAPHRRNLAEIRRGGVDGLTERLAQPGWQPDQGPAELHPTAGATVIGARFFLIALNGVLATAEVAVARRIARTLREANGGLPGLKAIGVSLASRGRAQVSMNLVDFRRNSLLTVLTRLDAEARQEETAVAETELIGLVPQAAMPRPEELAALPPALRLPAFAGEPVLERRLALAGLALPPVTLP